MGLGGLTRCHFGQFTINAPITVNFAGKPEPNFTGVTQNDTPSRVMVDTCDQSLSELVRICRGLREAAARCSKAAEGSKYTSEFNVGMRKMNNMHIIFICMYIFIYYGYPLTSKALCADLKASVTKSLSSLETFVESRFDDFRNEDVESLGEEIRFILVESRENCERDLRGLQTLRRILVHKLSG